MKTKFTFLCCLAMVWCASLTAQTEFSKTGTRWYVPYEHDNIFAHKGYHTRMDLYRLGEDTLLAGESWKKLYYNERLQGVFREVGKEVWYKPLPDGTGRAVPRVLYDFSMQLGDKFYYAEYGVPGIFRNEEEAEELGLDLSVLQEMTVTRQIRWKDAGCFTWRRPIGWQMKNDGSRESEANVVSLKGGVSSQQTVLSLTLDCCLWLPMEKRCISMVSL